MALTEFTTSDPLAVKLWHEKLYRDARKGAYFSRFMGEHPDAVVQVKTNLTKQKGDQLHFGIRMRLNGAGVTGDTLLEGSEESLVTYEFSVTVDQLRHAVRSKGRMSDRRVKFGVPEESRAALRDWMSEKIDEKCFNGLDASPTKTFYGGNATDTTDVDTADKITLDLVTRMKTWAMTGGNRTQPPLRPLMVDGKRHFVLLVHPDVAYDIATDTEWKQAQREAEMRGKENPIFSGALGIWQGVAIHAHENIPIVTNWGVGTNVPGAKCQFLGAQALCWAWGERPSVKKETFDYGNQWGHAIGMIYGVQKPVFNSKDYGSIAVNVARSQISDA